MTPRRQALIGLCLAGLLLGTWLAQHVFLIFFFDLQGGALLATPFLVAGICWLNVGLFILAHDCMHRSLAPGRPALNSWIGRLALALYAGFSFDRLRPKHFEHHRRPGTADDPDFSSDHPRHFWRWYWTFFRQYFGAREWAVLTAITAAYLLLLGAPLANLLVFWAVPAIISSLQLFYFGTYLPHREEDSAFDDDHRARTNDFGWLASLLTCFHFGYHLEHHRAPHLPWWRLPEERFREATPR